MEEKVEDTEKSGYSLEDAGVNREIKRPEASRSDNRSGQEGNGIAANAGRGRKMFDNRQGRQP